MIQKSDFAIQHECHVFIIFLCCFILMGVMEFCILFFFEISKLVFFLKCSYMFFATFFFAFLMFLLVCVHLDWICTVFESWNFVIIIEFVIQVRIIHLRFCWLVRICSNCMFPALIRLKSNTDCIVCEFSMRTCELMMLPEITLFSICF